MTLKKFTARVVLFVLAVFAWLVIMSPVFICFKNTGDILVGLAIINGILIFAGLLALLAVWAMDNK